jgi:hypothetical protein
MAKLRKSRPKQRKQTSTSILAVRPVEILLDEQFLLCASGNGCDSKPDVCPDEEVVDREFNAVEALLAAYRAKVALVIDEPELGRPSQVREFYNNYLKHMHRDRKPGQIPIVAKVLGRWLSGRNGRLIQLKLPKNSRISPEAIKGCNLKADTLDPLLCELAIICRGQAPIWSLDSDFWCASQFHPEIKPTCPTAALASVK